MSFFNFRNQTKAAGIAKILASQEEASKEALHQKHPHTRNIFAQHQVDLRNVRHKGVKSTIGVAALGAFLAFPHLLGNPSYHPPKGTTEVRTLSESALEDEKPAQHSASHPSSPHSETTTTTPEQGLGKAIAVNSDEDSSSPHHNQGHIHGRSYLAPPKEHGLHDLGLHKGAQREEGKAQAPGPHPTDLGLNHPGKEKAE